MDTLMDFRVYSLFEYTENTSRIQIKAILASAYEIGEITTTTSAKRMNRPTD